MYRKMLDNPIMQKPKYSHLWNILLLLAQHQDTNFIWKDEQCSLKKGQMLTGRQKLSKISGLHESSVQRILKYLETEQQIEQQTFCKFRIITIKNWEKYQGNDNDEHEIEQHANNTRTTREQHVNTYKNVKNEKNEKNVKKTHSISKGGLGGKTFKPPTLEEFKAYITDKKLNIPNPDNLWGGYSDGNWEDTHGKKVRNWKLKLRTLHNYAEERKSNGTNGQNRLPKSSPKADYR